MPHAEEHGIFYLKIRDIQPHRLFSFRKKKVFTASRQRDINGNSKMDDVYAYGALIIILGV